MSLSLITLALSLAGAPVAEQDPLSVAQVVTRDGGYDASPAPDGRRIVYVRIIDRREQLVVSRATGGHAVPITGDSANHEDPAWSPDGRWIAYTRITPGHEVLHRVRPDGTGDTALTADSLAVIHPTWSADSRQILFCTDDDLHPPAKGTSEIYALDVASGRLRAMITGGTNTYPSLSPDGRRIVFRRMVGATISAVYIARADGSDSRDLTPQAGWDGWPEWSPDGTRIAFASNRGPDPRNWQVYVMNPDGGAARLVARTEGRATVPHWSRDGGWIYFSNCDSAGGCAVMRADMRAGVR